VSQTVIFIVGAIIFAIVVYGSVMAGGLAFARVEREQSVPFEPAPAEPDVDPPQSTDIP
jgi:hypothetical protein